jgi:hypothetical protein
MQQNRAASQAVTQSDHVPDLVMDAQASQNAERFSLNPREY